MIDFPQILGKIFDVAQSLFFAPSSYQEAKNGPGFEVEQIPCEKEQEALAELNNRACAWTGRTILEIFGNIEMLLIKIHEQI